MTDRTATSPAAVAAAAEAATAPARRESEWALGITLVLGGAIGLLAAFSLMLDEIEMIKNPSYHPLCNWSLLLECSTNLRSNVGALFGFPNPILGLSMFPAPLIVGVVVLCGVRLPRWFWAVFNLGLVFAMSLVAFMITYSIFVTGTLCPWCMSVWVAVIVTSLATTLRNLASGVYFTGPKALRVARAVYGWTPLIAFGCIVIAAVVAQLQLNVIGHIF